MTDAVPTRQRIDKWLWCARAFKTRNLATRFVAEKGVRLTRNNTTQRIEKAGFLIQTGDQIAFMLGERVRIFEVVSCGARRGPAAEARALYLDHSPPPPARSERIEPPMTREKGAGRPTKKDRRAIDAMHRSQT